MKKQYHFCLRPKKFWPVFQIYVAKRYLLSKVVFFHYARIKTFSHRPFVMRKKAAVLILFISRQ